MTTYCDSPASWVPDAVWRYLLHTVCGLSIRAIAREVRCHPSTIMRQVRRWENSRDDALVDEALRKLGQHLPKPRSPKADKETELMAKAKHGVDVSPETYVLEQEARRVLRRLCEAGAILAVASEMDKAVVVRETPDGKTTRTAVVDRDIAQALVIKEWISCVSKGRIARYRITSAGRMALSQFMAEAENVASGFADAQTPFTPQSGTSVTADLRRGEAQGQGSEQVQGRGRKLRYGLGDSPLASLARRKDRDGKPFLSEDLVNAGERLREDFELSQMGARTTQDWDQFLTGRVGGKGGGADAMLTGGSAAARDRVTGALEDLGPGLGDVALRCCCFLEGLEQAEQRMGWSARSGKIVLRIALQRLQRHYESLGEAGSMIG
ncbi:MAG: helix-turn-helix domain containing protein [Rhodobacterales bacterium]|nr:MAG: helix-turn-helix domain containing protein [Rhodobacterales bacterium]